MPNNTNSAESSQLLDNNHMNSVVPQLYQSIDDTTNNHTNIKQRSGSYDQLDTSHCTLLSVSPGSDHIKFSSYQPSTSNKTKTRDTSPNITGICNKELNDDLRYNIDLNSFVDGDGNPVVRFRHNNNGDDTKSINWKLGLAIWSSLIINIILFITKTISAISAHSLSVAAAAVDSALDLASQLIVWIMEHKSNEKISIEQYPIGRSRLSVVGVVLCASMMGFASLQLIFESVKQLITGYTHGDLGDDGANFDLYTLLLLIFTVVMKIILYIYCKSVSGGSSTALALAEDHLNDISANLVAAVTGIISNYIPSAWYIDSYGAIFISTYIAYRWYCIGQEQTRLLVGHGAGAEFINVIKQLAITHHSQLQPDSIKAYSFGNRFLVEIEVVMPEHYTVKKSHDICLELQMIIEQLEEVERCFVHIDYRIRDEDEHDQQWVAANKTELMNKIKSMSTPNNKESNESNGKYSRYDDDIIIDGT